MGNQETVLGKGWYHYEFHQVPSYTFHFSMPNWGSPARFSPDGTGSTNFSATASDFNNQGSLWLTTDKTFHQSAPELQPLDEVCQQDCPNNAPHALDKSVNGNANQTLQISLMGTDSDGVITAYQVSNNAMHGMVTINAAGLAIYVPEVGYIGTDSFSFTVTDDDGAESQAAIVNITLTQTCGNACIPVAQAITTSTIEGEAVDISLIGTDSNGVITSYTIGEQPTNGHATLNNNIVNYRPNNGFTGVDSFRYLVTDNEGQNSELATVTINVLICGIHCDPTADDKTVATIVNTPVTINLSGSDNGTISSYAIGDTPKNGSVELTDNQATYTPNTSYIGEDSFSYTVTDNDGNSSNAATVSLTVEDINTGGDVQCELVTNSWNTGYTASITVSNISHRAVSNWQVSIALPDGHIIGNSWSGVFSGTRGNITLSNASWNGTLAPNVATTLGFQASYTGALIQPTCE
ncbi:MAG: hypothetical protein ACI9LM_004364 [Alteromonadaceae bacterium]|jgi:hypothetical protein